MKWPEPNMQPVEVEWMDSVSGHGWRPLADWIEWEATPGMMQRSIGYLISVRDEFVGIVQSKQIEEGGSASEILLIPTAVIMSMRSLE